MPTLPKTVPPQAALQRLKDGNARFIARTPLHSQVSHEFLTSLSKEQRPHTIVLGCSDSRVPPELVFDQSFGDLFVIRLAGNIIAPGVFGSIQYAHMHLGTSLLVVLGHESCGAVKATLAAKFGKAQYPERIQQVVDLISPGLADIDPDLPAAKQLHQAIDVNVRWSMRQVSDSPESRKAFAEKRNVLIVGAVYELATGRVRWLDS